MTGRSERIISAYSCSARIAATPASANSHQAARPDDHQHDRQADDRDQHARDERRHYLPPKRRLRLA